VLFVSLWFSPPFRSRSLTSPRGADEAAGNGVRGIATPKSWPVKIPATTPIRAPVNVTIVISITTRVVDNASLKIPTSVRTRTRPGVRPGEAEKLLSGQSPGQLHPRPCHVLPDLMHVLNGRFLASPEKAKRKPHKQPDRDKWEQHQCERQRDREQGQDGRTATRLQADKGQSPTLRITSAGVCRLFTAKTPSQGEKRTSRHPGKAGLYGGYSPTAGESWGYWKKSHNHKEHEGRTEERNFSITQVGGLGTGCGRVPRLGTQSRDPSLRPAVPSRLLRPARRCLASCGLRGALQIVSAKRGTLPRRERGLASSPKTECPTSGRSSSNWQTCPGTAARRHSACCR